MSYAQMERQVGGHLHGLLYFWAIQQAGSVIAARLTENPKVKVLVIEAGFSWVAPAKLTFGINIWLVYSDIGQPDLSVLKVPFFAGQGVGTQFDWNYTTVNQVRMTCENSFFCDQHWTLFSLSPRLRLIIAVWHILVDLLLEEVVHSVSTL